MNGELFTWGPEFPVSITGQLLGVPCGRCGDKFEHGEMARFKWPHLQPAPTKAFHVECAEEEGAE